MVWWRVPAVQKIAALDDAQRPAAEGREQFLAYVASALDAVITDPVRGFRES